MKDRVGLWFQVLEERGHSDRAPLFLERLDGGQGIDFSFPHREMDGSARMAQILNGFGLPPAPAKSIKTPFILARIHLFLKGLLNNSSTSQPNWIKFDLNRTDKAPKLSWLLLNENANRILCERALCQAISVNALLLDHFSKAVATHLAHDSQNFRGSWMLPVSMRGAFSENFPTGNKVSYLPIHTDAQTQAQDIHAQIRQGFQANLHWSNWLIYRYLPYVGIRLMRKLSARYARKVFWIGTFSDLGDWTPQEIPAELHASVWVAAPVGSPNNPVSSAVTTWCGQKTISLRLHSSICAGRCVESAEEILKTFSESLSQSLRIAAGDMTIRHTLAIPSKAAPPFCICHTENRSRVRPTTSPDSPPQARSWLE